MSKFLPATAALIALCAAACNNPPHDNIPAATVAALQNPAAPASAQPKLSAGPGGQVVLSWVEALETGGHALRYSAWTGERWHEQVTVATGEHWFVNWADFPSVVPISPTLWAAHWLEQQAAGGYAYDVRLAISRDGGTSWGKSFRPHQDGTATEHGFVSLLPWRSAAAAVWLDGRNMVDGPEPAGGMTLRFAGIEADGDITDKTLLDELVCDCCQTDVAITDHGPIAIYRNRTPEEIRDIYIVRAVDGKWQPPQALADDGWQIAGCPVNGPSIAARGERVVAAWFTAGQDRPRVRFSRSDNSGRSFAVPLDIDTTTVLGRVAVLLLDQGDAAVGWLRKTAVGGAEFCVRLIDANGAMGPVRVVAVTSASRPAGFPQLARSDANLLFAWTSIQDDTKSVRTAIAPIAWLR